MMQFTTTRPTGENFTPRSLIYGHAKANRIPFLSDWSGCGLIVKGRFYYYDHWRVETTDSQQVITVYLLED